MRRSIFISAVSGWLASFVALTNAADIRISDHPSYDIVLEGTISPGDYDKLRDLIDPGCGVLKYNGRLESTSIFLASPGGSLTEAMKIGRLIRALRWETRIPFDYPANLRRKIEAAISLKNSNSFLCTSACFFVFVAGFMRSDDFPSPGINPVLGIHRPHLSDADLKVLSASQAMASAAEVRTVVEMYLKEMAVSLKYADLMFSIPRDKVRLISRAEFDADLSGYVPEIKDWINARCDKGTDVEKRLLDVLEERFGRRERLSPEDNALRGTLLKKLLVPKIDCEHDVIEKLRKDALRAYCGL